MPIYMDSPDEGRPVSVKLTADVRPYLEAIRRSALATLEAAGLSREEAVAWVERSEEEPYSDAALAGFRSRWVLGVQAADEAEIVWVELPSFEAPTADEFRRLFLGEIVEARPLEDDGEPS